MPKQQLKIKRVRALLLLVMSSIQLGLAAPGSQTQDLGELKAKVDEFLTSQTTGYPGRVTVASGGFDPNLKLAKCASSEAFLPAGSRAWGRTSVGIRCSAPVAWTIYTQAKVNVIAKYLVAAVPLAQGHVVAEPDMVWEEGDLTQLPPGIFTDTSQALGRTVSISMIAGSVLRQEMLKQAPVIQQGQTVAVTSVGRGFSVTTEGKALNNATEGQIVQVKVESGTVVSGTARVGGRVEVTF